MTTVIGIDVGAPAKGFHAVALVNNIITAKFHSSDANAVADWCTTQQASVVAIDAPCRWRIEGQPSREAERQLAAERISCFSTPTEAKATNHDFYSWIIAGQALYEAIKAHYPIYTGDQRYSEVAIETFPQAVACALAGKIVSAKHKVNVRRSLLQQAGIDTTLLTHIDEIDATLCALAARSFTAKQAKFYGDTLGGYIVVPAQPLSTAGSGAKLLSPLAASKHSSAALSTILGLLPRLTAAERLQLASLLEDLSS